MGGARFAIGLALNDVQRNTIELNTGASWRPQLSETGTTALGEDDHRMAKHDERRIDSGRCA
jgi:hypothetical protein